MTDYPKVSVVTITYGHENYITQTLDGVLMQNYPGKIEFIIANDNSPDTTDRVINDYLAVKQIPANFTIKYTRHEINKGMMANFVWAISEATGTYIALCEGDDYWIDPMKIHKQTSLLESNKKLSMCFHASKSYIQLTSEFSSRAQLETREYTGEEFLKNWLIPTASVVFRRNFFDSQVVKRLLNPIYIYGDIILFLSLEQKGMVYCINELMAVYRIHDCSMVRSKAKTRIVGNTDFINHHRMMSKDFNSRYKKNKF